jgi:cyanophycin synthetase
MKGDMTYPEHVALVLKDPTIDCAVLETSREGIIRSGLGYKFADFGIVLNIYNEHVGQDDIKYIEDLAYAKSVVAEEVYESGFTILNADLELVLEMQERLYSTLVLFSKSGNNPEVIKHTQKGGISVYISNDIVFVSGKEFIALKEIPLTFGNKAAMMYDEILASIATLIVHGINTENIKKYLKEFTPDLTNLPGRMNFIDHNDFKIFIDNAHNSSGFYGLKIFLDNFTEDKICVLDAAGDRYNEEIIKLGNIASQTYKRLYIYEGIDDRGRPKGEINALLKKGALEGGIAEDNIFTFNNFEEACLKAVSDAEKDQMIVILTSEIEKLQKILKI